MSDYMIETRGLHKIFKSKYGEVHAVNGIDLKVRKGEIHGFLGPNGAGKSTTIKMLVGAIGISQGEAFIDGNPVGSRPSKAVMGYAPDHPKFYQMTLFDYLVMSGRLYGLSRRTAMHNALALAEWFELEDALYRDVKGFSAGMRQKACLAAALVHKPPLVVMDEPTANLDALGRATVLDRVKSLAESENITVLISSHVLSEVEKIADQVTIIAKGNLVVADSMNNIKSSFSENHFVLALREKPQQLRIGEHLTANGLATRIWTDTRGQLNILSDYPDEVSELVVNTTASNSLHLETWRREEASLESIFLRAIGEDERDKEDEVAHDLATPTTDGGGV